MDKQDGVVNFDEGYVRHAVDAVSGVGWVVSIRDSWSERL